MKQWRRQTVFILIALMLSLIMPGCSAPVANPSTPGNTPAPTRPPETASPTEPVADSLVHIMLDDFSPQPYQGQPVYFFNRLEGDRGVLNDSEALWEGGQVTTTVSSGNSWGGLWMSLNHPIREGQSINFSAILPPQILPAYQSRITRMTIHVAGGTAGKPFKLELKDGSDIRWQKEFVLDGRSQVLELELPALKEVNQLVLVLDRASAGDYVALDSVSFTSTTEITDIATAAFVWSYGMLLNNWDPATGLVRDKAKDASGTFDAIQATGSLAAATALAAQLGIVERAAAVHVVETIGDALLLDVPRLEGLLPHWVKASPAGKSEIVEHTEWSSVDTVIAALGLLTAQSGLGLDTSGVEQMLQEIKWDNLITPAGISHGYTYSGDLIPYAWDAFGGESWLVELAYAAATNQIAPLAHPSPPTANGSAFIDELAWLLVPPPSELDYWGTDWTAYRSAAAERQITYYPAYPSPTCFAQLGLFGLSAGEVPEPSAVHQDGIYQAFGIGGAFAPANDGSVQGAPVVTPHYSAMIASLRPHEAVTMWDWLISSGAFSPLNNVESLSFSDGTRCSNTDATWNQLKGSWNLSLQALGWGRYLAERDGQLPIVWQAATANPFLHEGYLLLTGGPPPLAFYPVQSTEVVAPPIWDHTQVSCNDRPYSMWASPGTYLYKRTGGEGSGFLTVKLMPGNASPDLAWNRPPRGTGSAEIVGVEAQTTALGTFQATKVRTTQADNFYTGRLDVFKGKYETSEWYVCGYGLIHSVNTDTGTRSPAPDPSSAGYKSQSEVHLLSYTPLSTDESHVRYMLADMQLGRVADDYRSDVADEETAEALRRWDAGVRVVEIRKFDRKIVNGRWHIVYAGTENTVLGTDIVLNSDAQY